MKLLKGFFLLVVLLYTSVFLVAQENKQEIAVSVSEVIIKAGSIEEFETLDWDDLFTIFEDNTAKDSIRVVVSLEDLNFYKKDGDSTLINKLQVMVGDISENKEALKKHAQRSTDEIIKFLRKYQK